MEVEAMFPHEAQEMMAKILFLVFAALILCFTRINAAELPESIQTLPVEKVCLTPLS